MPEVRLTPRARDDLRDIYQYGADTWGDTQADTYIAGLIAVFDLLAAMPDMARKRHELRHPVRAHPHARHLILYDTETGLDGIAVIRVLHGGSDWLSLLDG